MILLNAILRDFPGLEGKTYLNTAAEGIPPLEVGAALSRYWRDKQLGMDGRELHFKEEAACRQITARLLDWPEKDIAFCSCAAEGYNLLASALALQLGDEVVINDLDFPSGVTPWLVKPRTATPRLWQSTDGSLEIDKLLPLLNERTRLVQTSLVSFYNGFRLPWTPFYECVRKSAPQALIAVDVTQAFGRCVLDCVGADILVSSTHKWALGIHGGCVVAVRSSARERLTTRAGGWHHLVDAFAESRFVRTSIYPGAPSYAVGMPSFAPIYALNAGLRYLDIIGIPEIAAHSDSLTAALYRGLLDLRIEPMTRFDPACPSGIVAFRHPHAEKIHAALHANGVRAMFHAGRVRFSVHGYNTVADISRALAVLQYGLQQNR